MANISNKPKKIKSQVTGRIYSWLIEQSKAQGIKRVSRSIARLVAQATRENIEFSNKEKLDSAEAYKAHTACHFVADNSLLVSYESLKKLNGIDVDAQMVRLIVKRYYDIAKGKTFHIEKISKQSTFWD